jgi:hypothetical protein
MDAAPMNGFAGVRAAFGMLLLLAPNRMVRLYSGQPADQAARAVARVLGARHLTQALLTRNTRDPIVLALGAEVDLVHAATAFGLAVFDPRRHREGLVDAAAATLFSTVGAALANQARPADPAGAIRSRHSARAKAVAWIAARTLPDPVLARLRER